MTKRHMIKPVRRNPEADGCSSAVWAGVGRQLRRRRRELDLGIDYIARCVGVSAGSYEGYERGLPIPASSLAQIADLLDTPVVWFFQDVGQEDVGQEDVGQEEPAGCGEAPTAGHVVYTVATVEHRAQALVDSFRKLDLEGQQHLLAISMALRASANAVPD